ncbi:MAG TPA: FAD-dependent oxidoreductase [Acidimicrobiales bacterium]|nr:FAD-dependent oxidoreductase [Acidimicrobiales bacterium]
MAHAVVVGAGVAGLGCALAFSARGHEVTLVERDVLTGDGPVTLDQRHGTPQSRHSHAFLARLRNLLRDHEPEVLAALLDAGATELRFAEDMPDTIEDRSPRPGDEDLVAIACRRTVFEQVVRDVVLARPGVTLVDGAGVDGLLLAPGDDAVPRVIGIRARRDGTEVEVRGEAVVDAGGRRSRLPELLAAAGCTAPTEEQEECGIVYLSRFYDLAPGREMPRQEGPIGGDLGYLKYAIFPGDRRSFSITFAVATGDHDLRTLLLSPAVFEAVAATLPITRPFADPALAAPVTDVALMAGLRNQYRRFVVDGAPVATGVHAVGDAHVCTNPLYGRGCALAMVHAHLLAEVLDDRGWATSEAVMAFHDATAEVLGPWYEVSVAQDRASMAALEAGDAGPNGGLAEILRDGLLPAARTDAEVFRAFVRAFNLLDHPNAVMEDPVLVGKVLQTFQDRDTRPPVVPDGPDRDALLAVAHAAHAAAP